MNKLFIPIAFMVTTALMKRGTSLYGIDALKKFEDFRAEPYQDEAGNWTIGYGHLIKEGETFTTISEEEASILLKQDLEIAQEGIREFVNVPLTKNQFDALALFIFNVGVTAFQNSTMREKLNGGDYLGAAHEFKNWVMVTIDNNVVPSLGLAKRRTEEYKLFVS